MLILEAPFHNETFYFAKTIEDIKNSPSNATLIFEYCDSSLEVYSFCHRNDLPYGVIISSIKELIFVSSLNAKYVFTDIVENAKKFQEVAEEYLLDTKIIYLADSLDEIEKIAPLGIDGIKVKEKRWQELRSHQPKRRLS
ncbi:hypothetical protein [Caminibacter pacificus]|uniref:Uncharacterized protein n=1 Tax=Caminibacter pacificus TaxID=1424653 RepID=A0AAJ4UXL9_9BACT|nr:hypothetical protein [Caminibacter pacificus]NPA88401.1 hypothetical protein [Campylobacterota bacterium]QCI28789.1 hypothetical protein C6V80_07360 [Caminibacter pacificus]ROR39377.1 hypothetical protein EDC58_1317 [Caminibacter pacificus]